MPNLRKAELDALTASIKRFGVVVPVVVDQDGEIIDGHNRTAVARQLGIDVPRQARVCSVEERDALRVELNAARRQLQPEQWQPMVDHLRQLGHSDRAIATAVGVNKDKVNRYQSPTSAPVSPETGAKKKGRIGEDGKRYAAPGEATDRDRILDVLRQNYPRFYTLGQLDSLDIPTGSISTRLSQLFREGLVRRQGKSRHYRFQAVPEDEIHTPPPKPTPEEAATAAKEAKVRRVLADAAEVRDELKDLAADTRLERQAKAALEAVHQEQDRHQKEEDARHQRLLDAEIQLATSRSQIWYALRTKMDALALQVAHHCRDFDQLPPPAPEGRVLLDQSIANLRDYLDRLNAKLYPGGTNRVARGTVIDADTQDG
jgi:hypothetical protein